MVKNVIVNSVIGNDYARFVYEIHSGGLGSSANSILYTKKMADEDEKLAAEEILPPILAHVLREPSACETLAKVFNDAAVVFKHLKTAPIVMIYCDKISTEDKSFCGHLWPSETRTGMIKEALCNNIWVKMCLIKYE